MRLKEIIFASHNKGKIAEIRQILEPRGIVVHSADDMMFTEAEETGATFEENAILKALAVAKEKNVPCLADDSGLCVKALGGRPGVYSARYAPNRDFKLGMQKLLAEPEMMRASDRSACVMCVMVLGFPNGEYISFEGRIDGQILHAPEGNGGFGFDPIFKPDGYDKSFAELGVDVKNKISHRAKALSKFLDYIDR